MKRMVKRIACLTLALGLCFGGVACQQTPVYSSPEELPAETQATLEEAYLARLNKDGEDYDSVEVIRYLGDYNGNTVALAMWQSSKFIITMDIVEYTVDGITVAHMGRNSEIIAYNAETGTIKTLKETYADGDISKSDLKSIQTGFRYARLENVYEAYLQEQGLIGEIRAYIGNFSGHDVMKTSAGKPDEDVDCVCVDYYVDGMYICQLNDPSYDLTVYTKDGVIKALKTAYEDGDITKSDLYAIKAAMN